MKGNNFKPDIILIFFLWFLFTPWMKAQQQGTPKWAGKVQKSLVSVTTYDKNNQLLHNGTGVYINGEGEVVACYSLFRDAYSAVVTHQNGKTMEVERILGADTGYDVVRFQVNVKHTTPVQPAIRSKVQVGTKVYALSFSNQKGITYPLSTISRIDVIDDNYAYYTLETAFDENSSGTALFDAAGDWIGVLLSPIGGHSYAIDGKFATDLTIPAIATKTGSMALNNIHIKKGLPQSVEEALVYLYFKSRSADNDEYLDLLNLFISTWPQNAEGYYRRATTLTDLCRFDEAEADLQEYLKLAADHEDAMAKIASSIYTKLLYQPEPAYDRWNYDVSLQYIDKAIQGTSNRLAEAKDEQAQSMAEANLLQYRLQKAQILMAKKDYKAALQIYEDVNKGPYRSPGTLYAASLAHEAAGDSASVCIALIDSALTLFPTPLPQDAANYVMRRGQLFASIGKYREAVLDYNQYCYLYNNKVNAQFYYDRSQLEVNARMFQQALDDLSAAIDEAPRVPLFHVEKSGLLLRVGMIDECMEEARQCLQLEPDNTDAYRILGYAQFQKGQKQIGRQNLQKAADMGDEAAKTILEKLK